MPEPIQVYPPPDGGVAKNTVPVDGGTATAGTASGAVAAGSLLVGTGNAVVIGFLQMAGYAAPAADGPRFTAVPMPYVTVAIIFGVLSVLLWTVALVRGYRMKERAMKISEEVCQLCEKNGIFKKHGYKTPAEDGSVPIEA
jgi:hypothetical protein